MDRFTGNKNLNISDNQILKLFTSALFLQFLLSLLLLNDNINILIFIIYNTFIWGTYMLLKKVSNKLLKYNVYLIYLAINIVPIFLYLMVIFKLINNTFINLILFMLIIILIYVTQKMKIQKSDSKKKNSGILLGGFIGIILSGVIVDNVMVESTINLFCIFIFLGIIFYILRFVKIYEKEKSN